MARHFGKPQRRELKALDLGCGQGASTWFLAREGFKVMAVDGSWSALEKANARMAREGLPFESTMCCLTKLPFPDNSFDVVVDVVSSVHNSMDDILVIFDEVARVLKPKGKLFSVMPTNTCSRRTFRGITTTFMDRTEIEGLLKYRFKDVEILCSTYQLDYECRIELWIVTADRLGGVA